MEQEAQRRWDEGKLSMCLDDWNGSSISKGCKDAQQCLHLWRAQVEYGRKDREEEGTEDIHVLNVAEHTLKTFCMLDSVGIQSNQILMYVLNICLAPALSELNISETSKKYHQMSIFYIQILGHLALPSTQLTPGQSFQVPRTVLLLKKWWLNL